MTSQAAILLLAADLVLTLMDAIIKSLTARFPTFQIAFLRFAAGGLVASLLLVWLRPPWPGRETVVYNSTRALLVIVTATSFFYALGQLPLADTIALSFLSPVFLALFGALLLAERIDRRVPLALLAGLAGMVMIAGGGIGSGTYGPGAPLGTIAVLVSAVSYALVLVLLRARANQDALIHIVWFQNVLPAVMLAAPAALVWQWPTEQDWATFTAVGVLGVLGHCLMGMAFARAEASRLAPLHYMTLVWGILLGALMFAEIPPVTTWLGAGLIVAAALIAQRSRR